MAPGLTLGLEALVFRLWLIPIGAALLAQEQIDPTERLARARDKLVERAKRLPDYTCVQTVERARFRRVRSDIPFPPCERVRALGTEGLMPEATDRLRLDIKASRGSEIGSWPGSRFSERSIFELVGAGSYQTGMLGALISDVFVNEGAAYQFVGEESPAGGSLSSYSYQVPVDSSHYQVKSGSSWVPVAFSGTFWLDTNTQELKRISEEAHDLPADTLVCSAATTVDYQQVRVAGGEFLLPRQAAMRLVMQDESETRITATYSGCREYRAESTIRFDDAPGGGAANPDEALASPVPAGLRFSLALTTPIDTDTGAAGDIVKATLRDALRDPKSKAVLAPAGATVQGRVVQMQHWLNRPRHFTIAIVLEKLEADGVSRPLHAKVVPEASSTHGPFTVVLRPQGQSSLAATFRFETEKSRVTMRAGFRTKWATVEPPAVEVR